MDPPVLEGGLLCRNTVGLGATGGSDAHAERVGSPPPCSARQIALAWWRWGVTHATQEPSHVTPNATPQNDWHRGCRIATQSLLFLQERLKRDRSRPRGAAPLPRPHTLHPHGGNHVVETYPTSMSGTPVVLHCYDLSNGLAKQLSPMLLGRRIGICWWLVRCVCGVCAVCVRWWGQRWLLAVI